MPVLKRYTDTRLEAVRARAVAAYEEALHGSSWWGREDQPGQWGLSPFAWDEASDEYDIVGRANYDTVAEDLGDAVEEIIIRHWVGGIPIHLHVFRVDLVDNVETLAGLVDAYESYPLLDEDRYSRYEDERRYEELRQRSADELSRETEVFTSTSSWEDKLDAFIVWLAQREIYRLEDTDEDTFDSLVREFVLRAGLAEPDPERGEDERSAVDLTWLKFHPDQILPEIDTSAQTALEFDARKRNLEVAG